MKKESEAIIIRPAREDDDGYAVDLGDWEVTLHAIRGDLKRGDLTMSLTRRIVLMLVARSFIHEIGMNYGESAF